MGVALVAFQLEELVRRVFMATMRFWRLVVIDSAAVVSALAVIGIWTAFAPVAIITFFTALGVGQLIGIGVGVAMLPVPERTLVSLRGAAIKTVAGFGAWRGRRSPSRRRPHRDAGRGDGGGGVGPRSVNLSWHAFTSPLCSCRCRVWGLTSSRPMFGTGRWFCRF